MTEDLTQTVERARGGGPADFAVLVREFQDVTFGCAYSYLGDFHLAAEHYDREAEALTGLHTLCGEAALARGHREEAESLLVEATKEERAAISVIEEIV